MDDCRQRSNRICDIVCAVGKGQERSGEDQRQAEEDFERLVAVLHAFGLFLDQRQRRRWVKENSKDKDVLNLFAFTCGFSLNAACGEARSVVSVDLFAKYLEWGKENFELNEPRLTMLPPTSPGRLSPGGFQPSMT